MRRYLPLALALLLLVVLATQASAMPHWLSELLKNIGYAYEDTFNWGYTKM